jgi:hypothetical protein
MSYETIFNPTPVKSTGSYPWFCFYRTDVSEKKSKIQKLLRRKFFSFFGAFDVLRAPPNFPANDLSKNRTAGFSVGRIQSDTFLRFPSTS